MKRLLIAMLILSLSIFTGCSKNVKEDNNPMDEVVITDYEIEDIKPEFDEIDDPELLEYLENEIITNLEGELDEEEYNIDNVQSIYYSQEYINELEYNSKSNIYFGYDQNELNSQFTDTKYVLTLSEDGNTIVEPFKDYVNPYNAVLKNVAIGSGVILVCVTLSTVTTGTTVSIIFATAAQKGTTIALSGSLFSGVSSGIIKGIQTKDFNQAKEAGIIAASEGFKWGAMAGVLTGGLTSASNLKNAGVLTDITVQKPSWRIAELEAISKYGGQEQMAFKNGVEVAFNEPGATRPDIVRKVKGGLEAIEVKKYNLDNASSLSNLVKVLRKQIGDRIINLPEGSTQRIVLDVTDKGYNKKLVKEVVKYLSDSLDDIYPNIPIDVIGL